MRKPYLKVEIFKDKKKEWRWRASARNGKIIATSGEGYKRAKNAIYGFAIFHNAVMSGRMYVKE